MSVSGNFVGIDYHQEFLYVSVLSGNGEVLGNRKVSNSVEKVEEYVSRFGSVSKVALEASTGSANFADEFYLKTGVPVRQCHPGYVNRMKLNPDKTDKSDSLLIGDLLRLGYLPEVWLAPEYIRELRSLVRHRYECVQEQTRLKLRIGALLRNKRIKRPGAFGLWTNKGVDWLESIISSLGEHTSWIMSSDIKKLKDSMRYIQSLNEKFQEAASKDPMIQKLMSQKGVGIITATVMRAEIGIFSRFKRGKQLARFCGFSPRNASSGMKQADSGLIKAGNPVLKACLIQAGHLIMRNDKKWQEMKDRLMANGKKYCVVVAAIVNRWLRSLFYEMKAFEKMV
jgi:transposase